MLSLMLSLIAHPRHPIHIHDVVFRGLNNQLIVCTILEIISNSHDQTCQCIVKVLSMYCQCIIGH